MAGKKPASKTRKNSKPAAVRSTGRKTATARSAPKREEKSVEKKASATRSLSGKTAPKAAAAPVAARKPAPAPAPAAVRVAPAPVLADAEDGDHENSLLAGPRNVKPYAAKRGERYMNKEQLDHFRTILQTWKRDLMEEVDRTVTHMKDEAANFPDPNDRATQEEEFSLELRTRDRERKLIRKIDEALKRTDDGSYGYCLETGEEIGVKRLEARPVATLSIEAQERRERRERQYGDRDDRYR